MGQRPREKALFQGLGVLSDGELLALVIQSGTCSESALALANRLLEERGGLSGMAAQEPLSFLTKGISKAKALKIGACFELGKRVWQYQLREQGLSTPVEWARYFKTLSERNRERPLALILDKHLTPLRLVSLGEGGESRCYVQPKDLAVQALQAKGSFVILCHCHPSQNPKPSLEDLKSTVALSRYLTTVGLVLKDHLIIAKACFYSFATDGITDYEGNAADENSP